MTALIDTNVAIHLRDRDVEVVGRIADLATVPLLSIISRVELEGGVTVADATLRDRRRKSLDELISRLQVLDFNDAATTAYANIVAVTGYSRPRVLDRMIAATAIAHDASLITINGQHFRDIPGLKLIEWPSPSPA